MRFRTTAVVLAGAFLAVPAQAQQECGKAHPKEDCRVTIDRAQPVSGRSVTVENETKVTVVLANKSPFESCRNDIKREEIPDVSPVPALLSLVGDLAGSFFAPKVAAGYTELRHKNPTADDLGEKLEYVARRADAERSTAQRLQQSYDTEAANLKTFYGASYVKSNATAFERDRALRQAAVEGVLKLQIPQPAAAEATYRAVTAEYSDYVQTKHADPAVIAALAERIDSARSMLDTLSDAIKLLDAERTRYQSTLKYIEQLKQPEWDATLPVRTDRSARVTGNVSCTSDITGRPTLDPPVVYTVVFKSAPLLSLTGGVLLSTVPRNSVASEQVEDNRSDHTVTTHTEIRDHPSRPQAIPFSFVNIRLGPPIPWRRYRRSVTVNLTPGLGVNPNNGGTRAEFFLGGSVGIDSLFLSLGAHIGHELRPANGLQVLDRTTSDTKVPVEMPWTLGLGFSASYRIPLK